MTVLGGTLCEPDSFHCHCAETSVLLCAANMRHPASPLAPNQSSHTDYRVFLQSAERPGSQQEVNVFYSGLPEI